MLAAVPTLRSTHSISAETYPRVFVIGVPQPLQGKRNF